MSSPVSRIEAAVTPSTFGVGPVLVAFSHDRAILEYPLTLPRPSMKASCEEQETIVLSHPPGARNCRHRSVEELPLDLEAEEISDVQLQVNTVLCLLPRSIKHISPSWSVERIQLAGEGRGSIVSHLSPSKASTTCNSLLFEPRPPATTSKFGDLLLTEDVLYLLVGIGGSEGSHCRPVVLVRSWLVGSRVEGLRPPNNTNLDW